LAQNLKAHLGLAGTNLFFAANYTIVKYFTSHQYAGPFGLNIIRTGGSLALFWIIVIFNSSKEKITRSEIVPYLLCALTAIALNQMLFIKGLSLTFSIHASLLTLMTPILITVIAAGVLKEKLTVEKGVGLLLGASGALLLIASTEPSAAGDNVVFGDFLILLSAVAYTFYFILVKPFMEKYSAIHVMRWVFTFGFFLVLPLSVPQFTQIKWEVFTIKEWLLLFFLTVPGTFLAYIFNAYGIKKLSASVAGAYIYSQPLFAVAIAMIFLKEQLSLEKVIAAAFIFTGVYLSNRKVERDRETLPKEGTAI
jgi:drug/metabolite transporter (DMT)-like permease